MKDFPIVFGSVWCCSVLQWWVETLKLPHSTYPNDTSAWIVCLAFLLYWIPSFWCKDSLTVFHFFLLKCRGVLDGFNLLWQWFDGSIVIRSLRKPGKTIRSVILKSFSQTCCFAVPSFNSSREKLCSLNRLRKRRPTEPICFLGES